MIGRFNPAGLLAGRPDVQKQAMMAQQQPETRQGLLGRTRGVIGGLLGGIGNQIERGQAEDEGFNLFRFRPPEGMNQSDMIAMGTAGLMDAFVPQMGGNRLAMQSQMTGQRMDARAQQQAMQQQQEQMAQFRASLPPEQQALFDRDPEGFVTQMTQAEFRAPELRTVGNQLLQVRGGQATPIYEGQPSLTGTMANLEAMRARGDISEAQYAQGRRQYMEGIGRSLIPGLQMSFDDEGKLISLGQGDQSGGGQARLDAVMARRVEGAFDAIDSTIEMMDTIGDIRQQMEEVGPGAVGALGALRGTGAGIINQLQDAAQYGAAGQTLARLGEEAMSDTGWASPEERDRFFSDRLSGVDFLVRSLAYAEARRRNPGQRLTNQMVRDTIDSMGLGALRGDAQFREVLDIMERQTRRQHDRARQEIQSAATRGVPNQPGLPESTAPTQAAPRRAVNPQTGEVIVLRNGQWVPE
jgi:hypothetical protein